MQSHHDLQSLPQCLHPFGRKLEQVCVNPYHYERIESAGIQPVLVPVMKSQRQQEKNPELDQKKHFSDNVEPAQQALETFSLDDKSSFPSGSNSDPVSANNGVASLRPGQLIKIESGDEMDSSASPGIDAVQSPYNSALASPDVDLTPVPYVEQLHWCSIAYYELQQRVGESFHATQPSVIVDGFCAPSDGERFCLGQLSNVQRSPDVADARKHIGRGARFYFLNQQVYAENLGDNPIFVQSPLCNHLQGWHPGTVAKLQKNTYWKIFDCVEFAKLLAASVRKFEPVYALTRMCTIRISFVKGWGEQYRRQTITATPCWIEIHLNSPLKWLDRVLQQMGNPSSPCHSFT